MSPTRLMQPITLDGLLAAQDEIQRQSTARTPPVRMRIHPDLRQHLVDQLAPGKTPTFTSINSIPVEDDPSLPEGALELDPAEGRSPAMVFICRRGRPRTPPCSSCGDFYAPLLCDWKIGLDKKKTCGFRGVPWPFFVASRYACQETTAAMAASNFRSGWIFVRT